MPSLYPTDLPDEQRALIAPMFLLGGIVNLLPPVAEVVRVGYGTYDDAP
ncbi:hypothetical protein [Azospirillum griseum]|nr:hypothetical protein [Azospirillum griseum]